MRVALSLGSGGARGYAEIGVIDEIKARGHEIVAVAGTSMGAVIGGLEASGHLDEFATWVSGLTQRDVLRLVDPAFGEPGVFRAIRVMTRVSDIIGESTIEDLPIPFTAVATDLTNKREVWFQSGPLVRAMRASIGIPGVITPVMVHGRMLADGGIMNPVPMEPLNGVPADLTIAVDVNGPDVGRRESQQPSVETAADLEGGEWFDRLKRGAAEALDGDFVRGINAWFASRPGPRRAKASAPELDAQPPARAPRYQSPAEPEPEPAPLDPLDFEKLPRELRPTDIASLSMEMMGSLVTRFRMAANPPDVLVSVPHGSASTFDFHRATELIERGRELGARALDAAGY